MKKIFVLTGEPSGDKLASTAISKIQKDNNDIKYLSVGGVNLERIGIKSIFELKEITYLGFTSVLLNIFKIKNRINQTVNDIQDFRSIRFMRMFLKDFDEEVVLRFAVDWVPNSGASMVTGVVKD